MSEEKKFYRTTLTLTFLSDQPVDDLDADALVEQSNSGDLVMSVAHRSSKEVNWPAHCSRLDRSLRFSRSTTERPFLAASASMTW